MISPKHLIEVIVPHYLLITIFAPVSSYMVINGALPDTHILPVILSLSFAALGFNSINMVFDAQIDKIEKPLRPIPSGKISVMKVTVLAIFFYALAFIISLLESFYLFFLIAVFFVVTFTYSSPWPYYKKHFWASSFAGTIAYGIIPFLGALVINLQNFNIVFLVFFALLYAIISNSKDFEDMVGEKKLKIHSIPLILNSDLAAGLIIFSVVFLLLAMGYLSIINIIGFKFIYSTIISIVLFLPLAGLFWRDIQKIKYKNMVFEKYKDKEIKQIISQSDAVTYSIIFVIIVQLLYGFVAITPI